MSKSARNAIQYIGLTKSELDSFIENDSSCIEKIHHQIHIVFPPHGLANGIEALQKAIENKHIGFYEKELDGIVLAMKNIKVMNNLWKVRQDYSPLHFDVTANFFVFKPKIGMQVEGVCKHQAKNHISVILYRVFNVTIRLKSATDVSGITINSNVKFIITDINLKTSLPYLVGQLIRDKNNKVNIQTFSDNETSSDDEVSITENVNNNTHIDAVSDDSTSENNRNGNHFKTTEIKPLKSILKKTIDSPYIKREKLSRSPSPIRRASPIRKRISFMNISDTFEDVKIKEEVVSSQEDNLFKKPLNTESIIQTELKKKKKSKRKSFDALNAVSDLISSVQEEKSSESSDSTDNSNSLDIQHPRIKKQKLNDDELLPGLNSIKTEPKSNNDFHKSMELSINSTGGDLISANQNGTPVVSKKSTKTKNLNSLLNTKSLVTNLLSEVNSENGQSSEDNPAKYKIASPIKSTSTTNGILSNEEITPKKEKQKKKSKSIDSLSSILLKEIKQEPKSSIEDYPVAGSNTGNSDVQNETNEEVSLSKKKKKKKKSDLSQLSKSLLNEFS